MLNGAHFRANGASGNAARAEARPPFNPYESAEDFISAIEELRARDQWVGWKLVMRAGARKPTKPPVNPHNGFAASHSKPSTWGSYKQAQSAVKRYGLAGVGYVLSDDDDYTGVDLDKCRNAETGEIEDWAKEVIAFAETYTEISPSGTGVRMFVRGKIDKAVKCDVARVEIYGAQRYLTITNNHVEGTPLDIREAPKTLAALTARAEAMAPKREERPEPERPRSTSSAPRSNETGARAWAAAALDGKAAELASLGEGGRNHALNASAYSMGTMIARGWIDEPTVRAKLEDACRANGLWKDDGPFGVRATMTSGLRSGMANPHPDLPEREDSPEDRDALRRGDEIAAKRINDRGETPEDQQTTEEEADVQEENPPANPARDELPEHLTIPAGVLGEIVNWIVASAQRPNRVLALGAAIVVLATIIGRRVAGPTTSGTHQYVIMLAKSAAGKDHPLRRAIGLLNEVNPALVGPGEFTSQPALIRHVGEQPLSLCALDELGAFVGRICHPKASNWERGLTKVLREYWGASFDTIPGTQWASMKTEAIRWPALSLLGVSTHQDFFDAMSSKEATNGFLNRFLMLSTVAKVVDVDEPTANRFAIPQAIKDTLTDLYARCGGGAFFDNLEVKDRSLFNEDRQIPIGWANEEVRAEYRRLVKHALAKADSATIGEIYGRTAEMAVRLATIHAVSRDGLEAQVTHEDFAWGRDLAMWSADTMAREASMRMSDTEAQARANHVLRIIYEAGGKITHRILNRKLQHRLKVKELDETIAALTNSGTIERRFTQNPKGGPKTNIYVLRERSRAEAPG